MSTPLPEQRWTVSEAAEALGVSGRTVRNWCASGELPGEQSVTGVWTVLGLERTVGRPLPATPRSDGTAPSSTNSSGTGFLEMGEEFSAGYELLSLRAELSTARVQLALQGEQLAAVRAERDTLRIERASYRRQLGEVLRQFASTFDEPL